MVFVLAPFPTHESSLLSLSFKIMQSKWYFYVLLGLVDVEANYLGKPSMLMKIGDDFFFSFSYFSVNIHA